MQRFNDGQPYHGSEAITAGKLRGATDTDYFYFFCPKCSNDHIMRILEYEVKHEEKDNPYNSEFKVKAKRSFVLAFKLRCENCGHVDFLKISNTGWQGGTYNDLMKRVKA